MTLADVMDNRLVHVALLSILAIGLVALLPETANERLVFVAVAPVLTWYLGVRYERALVVNAGLVEEDDVKDLERENAKLLFRRGD